MQEGVEIQPMSQERRHGGGKQGRASVNCSPDSCGMQSLIGVIGTPRRLRDFFVCPKGACIVPIRFVVQQKGQQHGGQREERLHRDEASYRKAKCNGTTSPVTETA